MDEGFPGDWLEHTLRRETEQDTGSQQTVHVDTRNPLVREPALAGAWTFSGCQGPFYFPAFVGAAW